MVDTRQAKRMFSCTWRQWNKNMRNKHMHGDDEDNRARITEGRAVAVRIKIPEKGHERGEIRVQRAIADQREGSAKELIEQSPVSEGFCSYLRNRITIVASAVTG
ncbi:hypothetical protein MRB53_026676 [Persea americana]|uniref:Uncharacterized protein n=1 Tax=Persea americana TaxID=3435 RepID=A0ACC2LJ11_PERAE|nr:hypothetical protein MRB53_026676 [Persea americana]